MKRNYNYKAKMNLHRARRARFIKHVSAVTMATTVAISAANMSAQAADAQSQDNSVSAMTEEEGKPGSGRGEKEFVDGIDASEGSKSDQTPVKVEPSEAKDLEAIDVAEAGTELEAADVAKADEEETEAADVAEADGEETETADVAEADGEETEAADVAEADEEETEAADVVEAEAEGEKEQRTENGRSEDQKLIPESDEGMKEEKLISQNVETTDKEVEKQEKKVFAFEGGKNKNFIDLDLSRYLLEQDEARGNADLSFINTNKNAHLDMKKIERLTYNVQFSKPLFDALEKVWNENGNEFSLVMGLPVKNEAGNQLIGANHLKGEDAARVTKAVHNHLTLDRATNSLYLDVQGVLEEMDYEVFLINEEGRFYSDNIKFSFDYDTAVDGDHIIKFAYTDGRADWKQLGNEASQVRVRFDREHEGEREWQSGLIDSLDDPEEPDDPEDPIEPEEPADPKDPVEPSEPENPEDPIEPEEPVEPADPGDTEDPEDPVEPSEPENPEDPIEPEEPVEPADPADPKDPVDPEDPADPIGPEPEETVNPKDPEGPVDSKESIDPAAPVEGETASPAAADPDGPVEKVTSAEKIAKKSSVKATDKHMKDGKGLPNTATNTWMYGVAGATIALVGVSLKLVSRRRRMRRMVE